jgi:hypothetical protein
MAELFEFGDDGGIGSTVAEHEVKEGAFVPGHAGDFAGALAGMGRAGAGWRGVVGPQRSIGVLEWWSAGVWRRDLARFTAIRRDMAR